MSTKPPRVREAVVALDYPRIEQFARRGGQAAAAKKKRGKAAAQARLKRRFSAPRPSPQEFQARLAKMLGEKEGE